MPGDAISLGGQQYQIGHDRNGALLWSRSSRPSQRGDPGGLAIAEWSVSGSDLYSFESIGPGQQAGHLGRDYGSGTDGRWDGVDCLGPLISTVSLSTYDHTWAASIPSTATFRPSINLHLGGAPSTDDAVESAVQAGIGGTYAYIARGTYPAKVLLDDMTLKRSGEQLLSPATGIVATRSNSAVREISVGMTGAPYRVLTAIAQSPDPDTWVTNDDGQYAQHFGIAPDRIAGYNAQEVLGNVLTGAVTMAAPNWQTVTTIDGESLTLSGFEMDGSLWVIGTSNGPYMLDVDNGRFFPLIAEIDNDEVNGKLASWFPIGIVLLLRSGLRQQRFGQGQSFGPERFAQNQSPLQGYPTAAWGSTRWLYIVIYNPVTGNSYLTAWHPREPGDQHSNIMSVNVIASLGAVQSQFLRFVGTVNGVRTNETLIGGYDDDMFYMLTGRTAREIDDSTYRYTSAGTTYLTELRRDPSVVKDFEAVEFESDNCTFTRTVTLGFQVDGGAWNTLSGMRDYPDSGATLNGVINTDGFQRLLLVDDASVPHSWASGRRIKPRIAYATDSAATSPQVVGTLRLTYRTRPRMVDVYQFAIELEDNPALTSRELADRLLTQLGRGPVLVDEDPDGYNRYHLRIESVEVSDSGPRATNDNVADVKRMARITGTQWSTIP